MKTRIVFALAVTTALLMLVIAYPVVAEDVYSTTTVVTYNRIPYEDGTYGDIDFNISANVFDDWATDFNYDNIFHKPVESGVKVGAFFENLATVYSDTSGSVSPNYTCYTPDFTSGTDEFERPDGYVPIQSVIPLVKFYMNISADEIMNGAQEIYYRSPIHWDNTVFNTSTDSWCLSDDEDGGHNSSANITIYKWWLNVYDKNSNLVFASRPNEYSMNNSRMYTKMNMRFYSDMQYQFIEYVQTVDNNSVNSLDIYFANHQDIGNDNLTDTYIFPGTNHAKKLTSLECSWSSVFMIGIGRAGTEKLINYNNVLDATNYSYQVISQLEYISGTQSNMSANWTQVTIPFRTTQVLTMNLTLHVISGDNTTSKTARITDITGTIVHNFTFTNPDNESINYYWIDMKIENLTTDNYCGYMMYPATGITHSTNLYYDPPGPGLYVYTLYETNHFAMYWEIQEGFHAAPSEDDHSVSWIKVLVGVGIITGTILLAVFVGPPGWVALTIVGVGLITGGLVIADGFGVFDLEGAALAVQQGLLRLVKGAWDGVTWIGDHLWDGVMWLVETLRMLGDAVMHWGGIILGAIAELIWFIAFILILWLWSKFLGIMDGIAKGDFKKAFAVAKETQVAIMKPVTKISRTARVIKRFRR